MTDSERAGRVAQHPRLRGLFAVVVETLGGLAAALLLNAVKTGRRWLLAATVLPWALPPVINAIVWLWIYNPSYGLLTGVLKATGVIAANHVWFNDRATALVLIGLVHVWRMMPLTAVILLSALQGVPSELKRGGEARWGRPGAALPLHHAALDLGRASRSRSASPPSSRSTSLTKPGS